MNAPTVPPDTIHASAVSLDGRGILIRGRAGSGKSSLAMALIDERRSGARLVADDRVALSEDEGRILARAPERLAGLIEVRGVGIVRLDHLDEAEIAFVVDLVEPSSCPRFPEEADRRTEILGRTLPRLFLPIGASDGPVRLRMALRAWMD